MRTFLVGLLLNAIDGFRHVCTRHPVSAPIMPHSPGGRQYGHVEPSGLIPCRGRRSSVPNRRDWIDVMDGVALHADL